MAGGWRLHGYVVEGLLGQGGSGEVWRARVAATGEKVALKRVPVRDEVQVRRAAGEAAKLAVLEHPHLVRLHALVPDRADVVLVLDLAEGGSLAGLLDARGRLTPGEVITAIAPVAAALAHVHAAGVVHGDVTPANILFTAGGNALLADLGVARLTGEEEDAESTPAYVDPGVAAGGIPSELSDVFMLAATALHALTGEVPWPGATGDDALQAARAGTLGDLPTRLAEAGAPPAMVTVLCRALDRNPGRRGSAAALALDLRHSGIPVAVELDAGRARREPALRDEVPPAPTETGPRRGRHAAPPPTRTNRRGAGPVAPPPSVRVPPVGPAGALTWTALHPSSTPDDPTSTPDGPTTRPDGPGTPAAAPARPPFARPGSDPGAPPPTSRVHPRPRPQIPRLPRRPRGPRRPRAGTLVSAVLVLLVLATAGVLWSRHLDTSAGAQPRPSRDTARVVAPPTARSTPAPRSSVPPTPVTRPPVTRPPVTRPPVTRPPVTRPPVTPPVVRSTPAGLAWPGRLVALDALRARAFAERRPDLLRDVYASPALLRADTAMLLRIVPAGCGLPGARSSYRDVHVRAGAGRAVVTARATLPATTLVCDGVPSGRAPAVGPTTMRVTLVGPPATARIADQQQA